MKKLNKIGERRRRQMRLNYLMTVNKNKQVNTAQENNNVGNTITDTRCNTRMDNPFNS